MRNNGIYLKRAVRWVFPTTDKQQQAHIVLCIVSGNMNTIWKERSALFRAVFKAFHLLFRLKVASLFMHFQAVFFPRVNTKKSYRPDASFHLWHPLRCHPTSMKWSVGAITLLSFPGTECSTRLKYANLPLYFPSWGPQKLHLQSSRIFPWWQNSARSTNRGGLYVWENPIYRDIWAQTCKFWLFLRIFCVIGPHASAV